jgi:alpha-L-rhamnosidase
MKQNILTALVTSVIIFVVIAGVSQVFAQQEKCTLMPYHLRVEYMVEPRGIDELQPRFSWKLRSDVPGDEQTAYRIVVFPGQFKMQTSTATPVVWDSGTVKNSNSVNIEYSGDRISPGTMYHWLLTVTDKNGVESETLSSSFSTGLFPSTLDTNPWGDAQWIGDDAEPELTAVPDISKASWVWSEKPDDRGNNRIGTAMFRKTFELPNNEITNAACAFTGDNACKVFVNGHNVSEGTNFKNASVIDIAKLLKPGKNLIAVEVDNFGEAPNPAGLLGALKVQFKTSLELNIVTNASWKTSPDRPDRWNLDGLDDSAWSNAVVIAKCGEGPWGEITTGQPRPDLPARYLSYRIQPRGIPVRATAYICGMGYYELYMDNQKIGDHVLDPILKEYDISVPYVTYEIDPKLFRRSNDLQVILGNGRYYAPRIHEPTFTRTYGYPKLLFKMVMEYADGATQEVVSNTDWIMTTDGPIRANNDYDGEIYDARMEQNLKNERLWYNAKKVDAPKGNLVAQNMPPMRVIEEIKPVSLNEVSPGVWVFDMGQNMVGWCRLKVKGKTGTEVQLRHAEVLQDDGNLYMANIRGAKVRDIYTLKGDPDGETYEPRFSYHGFRFVEVTGCPGQPTLDTITGCVVHTDLPFVGKFECSNAMINQIHKNISWGLRGNYLSIPTDCPQRDERQGWQGDRAAESLGEMFLFDNVTLYSKWLQDIEESQTPEGNLSDVCPPFWPLYSPNVTWPSAFTIVPESILKQYGDDRPIRRHYAAMVKWLNFLDQFIKDGIIEADNYGDWCVPPERKELIHSQDPARKTSKGILATSYYIHNLNLTARYADMLGKPDEAKSHRDKAAMMTAAFNKKYYDAETGKYDNGTQTSCVLPLYFGLVPEGHREKVFATLMSNIENVTDYHIGTGLIGGQWLNRVLTEFGRADISYRFVSNTDYPSWGYMVGKGATTIWELWNGDTADPAMNSGNHVMLVGDLTIWLYQNLAGIKSDDGFQTLDMVPLPVGDLAFVNAEYDSIRGPVKSHWLKENDQFVWNVTIPVGAKAFLTVPTSDRSSIRVNGQTPEFNADGKITVGAGTYTVSAKW